jgi:hypothetical protein
MPALMGKFIKKKYFKPSCIKLNSLMLSSLDKSEFDPVNIQTTTFPSICDFIYSRAATPNAPAGST